MKQKNLSVTIGIPAYNEAANIRKVLRQILKQEMHGWVLNEVLIYCDGCTDNTAEVAKSIKNKRIRVFDDAERLGKTVRLSEMFGQFHGDILVMLDADISLTGRHVITRLISAFESENVMLAGGNSQPFRPSNFFEKAVYSTFEVFYSSRTKINKGNNIFGCTGSILAIRKHLAENVKFPKIINEDAYLYLFCLSEGYKFKYIDNAKAFYKLPRKMSDYIRQAFRSEPASVALELEKYFGALAAREFRRPTKFFILEVIKVFMKNPVGVIFIASLNVFCRPLIPFVQKNYRLDWFTAQSTK